MPTPPAFKHRRCLVTGASSGLGNALATLLAQQGARVIATGRDLQRLDAWKRQQLASGVSANQVDTFAADLTRPDDRATLVAHVSQRFDAGLDLLIQCAGVGAYGRFLSHDPSILHTLMQVNCFAVADLARELYPLLRAGQAPAMLVMGSIVARRGLPGRSEYSASKFALAGFIEAIRAEWQYENIHILMVNPGFTNTQFDRHLLVDTAYHKVKRERHQSAEHVARAALKALQRRKLEVTPANWRERLLLLVNRLAPRVVDRGLARWTAKLYRRHEAPAPQ